MPMHTAVTAVAVMPQVDSPQRSPRGSSGSLPAFRRDKPNSAIITLGDLPCERRSVCQTQSGRYSKAETEQTSTSTLLTALLAPLEQMSMRTSPSTPSLRSVRILQECPSSPSLSRSISRDSISGADMASLRLASIHPPTKPSLRHYGRFHGMFLGPVLAKRCTESFNGRVLSLPSSYLSDPAAFPPAHGLSPYDLAPLGLVKYYAMALSSWRGLSTLLCLTDLIDARTLCDSSSDPVSFNSHQDIRFPVHSISPPTLPSAHSGSDSDYCPSPVRVDLSNKMLTSDLAPSLEVDSRVLDYIAAHGSNDGSGQRRLSQACDESPQRACMKLIRRFEYFYRLSGTHAIVLHFKTLTPGGEVSRDAKGREVVHVVEVYELNQRRHRVLQALAFTGVLGFGSLFLRR